MSTIVKMKTVRFGNRGALKITEPTILQTVQQGIESKIGYPINQKRHSLLNHKNLKRLSDKPHQVGVNTLGQRFLLLLTTIQIEGESKRYSIFINRKSGMMIVVRFRFTADLFSSADETAFPGTLFEGELIRKRNGQSPNEVKRNGQSPNEVKRNGQKTDWYYLISDILIERGELVTSKPLHERLTKIADIIEKSHVPDQKQDPCSIQIKRYFEYQHIQSIISDYVPTLPYEEAVTGLAFKNAKKDMLYILPEFRSSAKTEKKNKKITVSKSAIKKPKPQEKPKPAESDGHFKLVETDMPDVFELFDKTGERVGYAAVPDLETSTLINDLLDEVEEDLYVQCTYSEKFSKWVPTKRADPF